MVRPILPNHSQLRGQEIAVAQVLSNPSCVMFDMQHEARECFYARSLPRPRNVYIKVVVEFQPEQDGVVVTAYPVFRIPDGEVQRWP